MSARIKPLLINPFIKIVVVERAVELSSLPNSMYPDILVEITPSPKLPIKTKIILLMIVPKISADRIADI